MNYNETRRLQVLISRSCADVFECVLCLGNHKKTRSMLLPFSDSVTIIILIS